MPAYTNLKTLKQKDSEIEFSAEISLETFAENEKDELAHFGRDITVPGFRKGKVPEAMLRERVDPVALLEETAESALHEAVREIAIDQKLHILGTPQIAVKELVPQKPISFTVRFALMPEITLPDYLKIGREILARKDTITITDAELDEAETHIRRIAAKMAEETKETAEDKKEVAVKEITETKENDLPALTDEMAQKIGNFKTVADLRAELKAGLIKEKEQALQGTKRDEIIQEIVKHTKIIVPPLLVDQEYERFVDNRTDELEHMGTTLEKYLEDVKKSEKDLEKEERASIERELKTSLTFQALRDQESISADEREIATNVAFLKRRYPNQDPVSFRRTAEAYIVQEKIFQLFTPESKKETVTPEGEIDKKSD